MKFLFWRTICICLLITARAVAEEQEPAPAALPPAVCSPEELEQLFGAIALYPDALVALILPATTVPSEVVLASRFLKANGNVANAENEPWDDSVKALLHYPDVINWMDQNLAWTNQAGEAFLAQPADVMSSIQRLRAKALAAGTLVSTPQQQVVVEGNTIRIIPAQTNVIYVPVYDPAVVYVPQYGYYSYPFLTFGVGWATGYWLAYDCDWGHHRIWTVDRHYREEYWHNHGDWRRPNYPGHLDYAGGTYPHQPWRPSSNVQRPSSYPGNRSRIDGNSPVRYTSNDSRNRPPDATGQINGTPTNGTNSTPGNGNYRDRSYPDGRGAHTNYRPDVPSSPTTPVFTPPQPDRVPRPATSVVSQQKPQNPPQNSPQNHRDRSDRGVPPTNDDTARNTRNPSAPSVPRLQPSQRPTQQAADLNSSTVRTYERPTAPTSSSVQQVRPAPVQPSPPPRSVESNPVQTRYEPPAPARSQSSSSDQTSAPARSDRNQNHRADRVPGD